MAYTLGIDIGTTCTAAAVLHDNGASAVVPLGPSGSQPAISNYLATAGMVSLDEAGARAVVTQAIVRVVTSQMGAPPRSVVVTHPGEWSTADAVGFERAIGALGIGPTGISADVAAAATGHAVRRSSPAGAIIAVCLVTDLGAHAAAFRIGESGPKLLGRVLGLAWPPHAPPLTSDLLDIPILLDDTLASASLDVIDLTDVVIAGNSSTMPTVIHLLQQYSGGKVAEGNDPLAVVATGAAVVAQQRSNAATRPVQATPILVPNGRVPPPPPPPPSPVRRGLLAPPVPIDATPVSIPRPPSLHAPLTRPTSAPVAASARTHTESGGPRPHRTSSPHEHGRGHHRLTDRPERSGRQQALRVAAGAVALFAAAATYGFSRSNDNVASQLLAPIPTVAMPAAVPVDSIVASAGVTTPPELPVEAGVITQPVDTTPPAVDPPPAPQPAPQPVVATQPVIANKIIGMVAVAGGNFTVGLPEGGTSIDTSRATPVTLSPYFIDATEVTNATYLTFLQTYGPLGVATPESWGDDGAFSSGSGLQPVVGVAFEHAAAYCQALGKRLPTEAEWEVAASYTPDAATRRLYPWGDAETDVAIPLDDDSTYDVGSQPANVSPVGAFDLAGNAWEYVADSYDPRLSAASGVRVVRGGTNVFVLDNSSRKAGDPLEFYMSKWAGFRCAVSADAPPPTETFAALSFTPAPEPAPHAPLETGEIDDDFKDPTFHPWPSKRTESAVWGYHPLDSFHLGTKGPGVDALAVKAVELAYEESQYTIAATGALIESRTESGDGLCFGIGTNVDDRNQGLFLAVCPTADPNNAVVRMFVRLTDGTKLPIYPDKNIVVRRDDVVELRIDVLAKDSFRMFLNGAQVGRDFVDVLAQTFRGFYDGRNVAMMLSSPPADSTRVHVHFHRFTVDKVTA